MNTFFRLFFLALACCAVAPAQNTTDSLYLPTSDARGGRWCLNPDSSRVRQIISSPPSSPSDQVSAADLAQDLLELQEFLRTQYPGYAVADQKPDFHLGSFFDQWRASLKGKTSVTLAEGVFPQLRELRDAIVDQHLSIWAASAELKKGSLMDVREFQAKVAGPPPDLKSCTVEGARRAYEPTLRISRQLSARGLEPLVTVTAATTGTLTLRCPGGKQFQLTERPAHSMPKAADGEPFYHWSSIGDTAVIRIRRLFGTTKDLENLSHIPKDYPDHAKFRRIVFDLRGNGGGDDSYVYAWISEARNGIWSSGAETKRVGALFPCFDWNVAVMRQVLDHSVDSDAARAERERIRSQWPSRPPSETELFNDGLVTDKSPHPYTGRVYVLADRQSISSGESSANVLRWALGATILGERTGGFLTFGNVRMIILPRTGIRVNVPTKRNWFDVPMEVVGAPVDLYLEPNDLPVSDLLPLLDHLEKEGLGSEK